ncbi:hypothetical protein MTR67_030411 [Solanum verrucosum]|uniref:Pru domain-containing protein n=1 Tax=Solanum verrucosum TaxID=315347 RepID=A0AAF0TY39_SOLVR|nr:hypothetical protein MTR67_030411 [Solanum verrucosum]
MGSSSTDALPQIQETLMEFRAGKMLMEGKKVIPDSRKGLVRIGRGEEGLLHFQWLDRNLNIVEDGLSETASLPPRGSGKVCVHSTLPRPHLVGFHWDQIVFPEEAVFEKVNQSSGRVYILKFCTDDRRLFFWMQEPAADNDAQLCSSVNFYLNQPLEFPGEDEPEASAPLPNSEDMVEEDISSRAGNLVSASMNTEASSDVTSSGPVKMSDLQRILSNIGSTDEAVDPDAGRHLINSYFLLVVFLMLGQHAIVHYFVVERILR